MNWIEETLDPLAGCAFIALLLTSLVLAAFRRKKWSDVTGNAAIFLGLLYLGFRIYFPWKGNP